MPHHHRVLFANRRAGLFGLLALLTGLTLLGRQLTPARAAFPGVNGKIAFTSNRDGNDEIYVMNADGSNQTRLTNNTALDDAPAWSPDGTKIAFHSSRDGNEEIYVMNADGSNQTRLTNNSAFDFEPGWSPDGTQIVFASSRDGDNEIYVMNADGSGQTPLTGNTAGDGQPIWSPDGLKIAFISDRDLDYEVYVMNSDGSGQTNLSNNAAHDYWPSWSPDGTQIAFNTSRDSDFEIYAMNSDGSGQTNLSNSNLGDDLHPAWSPDGTRIAFESSRDGNNEIYVMNANGSGQTRLTDDLASDFAPDWQPAARLTIAKETSPAGGQDFAFSLYPDALTFLHKWGSPGPNKGQFSFPSHVAVDEAGNVYVADHHLHRVQKFDNNGAFVAAWGYDVISGNGVTTFEVCGPADTCQPGVSGSGPGQFTTPDGIAARGGFVYVVEAGGRRVQKFSDAGAYLAGWGGTGAAAGQFNDPEGVAIDAAGNVYVADNFNHRVQKFDADGTFLLAWGWDVVAGNGVTTFEVCTPADTCKTGVFGGGKGQFYSLTGIAVDGDGNVYVTEPYNRRVQKFDGNGNFIAMWGYDVVIGGGTGFEVCGPADSCKAGVSGSGSGQFNFPTEVAVDMADKVYVTDFFNHRVQIFTGDGVVLGKIGSVGNGDGQFNSPNGVAVDGAGTVFVSDSLNDRIQKFGQSSVLLDDSQSHTYPPLQPGVYVLAELLPDGWTLDDIDCDGGSPAENGATVSLTLAAGDDVTCTFSNVGPPRLTIVKTVDGSGAPTNWSFGFSSTLGTFGLTNGNPDTTSGELAASDLVPGAFTVSEANPSGYATSASCDNGDSAAGGALSVTLDPGDDVSCTFTNTICQPGYYDTATGWACIPADPGYFVDTVGASQQTPCPPGYYQEFPDSSSCDAADPGYYAPGPAATEQTACPPGMTSPPAADSIDACYTLVSPATYFSPTTAGTTADDVPFGSEDILRWQAGGGWSVAFDGSAAGLAPTGKWKHNINAFAFHPLDGTLMAFAQNARVVPGIGPKVDGMDVVYWDGSSFSLYFDGQDVGLTNKTQEKIDSLHALPGSASPIGGGSCAVYLLISTQGPGKVTNYSGGPLNFSGEDVLGFCATNLGDTTTGLWHMVLDGSQQGMPKNSTDSISLSADGNTLYLTTKGAFNVDAASGGHSMVYAYDLTTQTFSGPVFVAPAEGLPAKVDGLQYEVTP